jgi:hypothetical protein
VALIEHEEPEEESAQGAGPKVLPQENVEIKVCGMNAVIPSLQ